MGRCMDVEPEEYIGSNAGQVWESLRDDPKTVRQIQEDTDLARREVTFALGWLAREGKIGIEKPSRYYRFMLDED